MKAKDIRRAYIYRGAYVSTTTEAWKTPNTEPTWQVQLTRRAFFNGNSVTITGYNVSGQEIALVESTWFRGLFVGLTEGQAREAVKLEMQTKTTVKAEYEEFFKAEIEMSRNRGVKEVTKRRVHVSIKTSSLWRAVYKTGNMDQTGAWAQAWGVASNFRNKVDAGSALRALLQKESCLHFQFRGDEADKADERQADLLNLSREALEAGALPISFII